MVDWRRLGRRLGVYLNLRDPPNVPPYGWSYFDHLVAVYVTLNSPDGRADAVIKKSHDRPDDLTWGDIFLLENVIFSLQPADVVARSAWILRERFREIAGSSVYDKYIASSIPVNTDTPEKLSLLKADLTRVMDVLHWYYSLIPVRERIRKSLTTSCMGMIVIYTAVLALFLGLYCYPYKADFLAMFACVVYSGIVGGFVSSQRRMQNIPSDGDPLISVFGLANADYYLWLSPLLGSIFAVVLTLLFIGGLLKGTIFPDFHLVQDEKEHWIPFFSSMLNALPKTSEEYGKLFIWAFLAGFAERLVPDSLDRLSSKLAASDRPQPSAPPVIPNAPPAQPVFQRSAVPAPQPKPKITEDTLEDVMHSGEPPK